MTDRQDIALAAERNRLRRLVWEHRLIVVITLIAFLTAWEIAGRMTNPLFFAPASEVAKAFWQALIDPQPQTNLASAKAPERSGAFCMCDRKPRC